MKKVRLNTKKNGFDGIYYVNKKDSKYAFIVLLGHEKEFYNATAKVLKKDGINALGINPYMKEKKNVKFSSFPLDIIENAIEYLKNNGIENIGIVGGSTWTTISLTASILFKDDIDLSIAFSPCDYVLEGLYQGKNKKMKEWNSLESSLTYKNQPLPYNSYNLTNEEYWNATNNEYLVNKEPHLLSFFNKIEENGINEESFIKVENANCKYVFFASKDDTMWDSVNHIERMKIRLDKANYPCYYDINIYEYGSHFLFPQSIIKKLGSLGGELILNHFKSVNKNKIKCRNSRIKIDDKLNEIIDTWIKGYVPILDEANEEMEIKE